MVNDKTLEGWWPLTETSGDFQDYSGNGNTGTYNVRPSNTTGPISYNSVDFAGDGTTEDAIEASSDVMDFNGQNPFTACTWVFLNTDSGENKYFFGSNNGDVVDQGWYIRQDTNVGTDGSILWKMDDGSNDQFFNSPNAYNDNSWHHVALVNDGSTMYGYVDGQLRNSGSHSVGDMNDGVRIGDVPSGTSPEPVGQDVDMFDARIYSRALSPQEIAYIYETSQGMNYTWQKKSTGSQLTTDSTLNTSSATLTVYEDDGSTVLSQSFTLTGGEETFAITDLNFGSGNDFWYEVEASDTDPTVAVEKLDVTVEY